MLLKSSALAIDCCPPKYHTVESQIIQYLEIRGNGAKGHGYWSEQEQAMEICHHDFKEFWFLTSVHHDHPAFAEKLFSAIIKYNSSHI